MPFYEGKRKREQCQDDQSSNQTKWFRKSFPAHLGNETTPSQSLPYIKGASTSRNEPEMFHTLKRKQLDFTVPVIEFVEIKAEPIDDEDIDEKPDLPIVINRSEGDNTGAVIVKTENVTTEDGPIMVTSSIFLSYSLFI